MWSVLDLRAGTGRVGCDVVQVQLEGRRPGVGEQPGVADPAARRRGVDAGDDGDVDRVAHRREMVEVAVERVLDSRSDTASGK